MAQRDIVSDSLGVIVGVALAVPETLDEATGNGLRVAPGEPVEERDAVRSCDEDTDGVVVVVLVPD